MYKSTPGPARGMISGPFTSNRAQLRKIWHATFKNIPFQDPNWRANLQALVGIKAMAERRLDAAG